MSDYQGNIIIKNPATPAGPAENGAAPGVWKLSEVLPFVRQGIWPTQGVLAADTFFRNVSLLLSTTSLGNANNNLFVDSSGAFNPISRTGNTTQGSATPYSASWSNFFDGSGDYFTVPYTAANFDWWTSGVDFTIECWFFANSLTGASYVDGGVTKSTVVGNRSATATTDYWSFGPNAGGTVTFYYFNGGPVAVNSTSTITANTWNHIAMTKTSSGITIFVNGVAQTTTAISGTPQSSASFPLTIGQGNNTSYNGYVSNLRIVRGTAIYSGNFTVPTAPLTAVTNTTLLTCQSNRFRDASTNNLTLTVTGNTSVLDFSPFAPARPGISYNQSDITNWSGYFDGTGDYLYYGASSAFAFGTGSFTVEFFVYTTSTTSQMIYDTIQPGISGGGSNRFFVYINTSQQIVVGPGTNTLTSSSSIQLGTWNHVAVVRSGTTRTIYINGVSAASDTFSGDLTSGYATVGFDAASGGSIILNGYLSNLRAVKGTAVYTSGFTPPTTNLTAISGTSLLTCQNAAFTDNSTNNFVVTINGNTTVTGNSPFNPVGYWSNYFNGGTDRLQVPVTSNMYLGTTYTIEAWVYYTGSSYGARPIFSEMEPFQGGFAGLTLTMNTSGQFVFEYRPATSGTVTTITGPTVTPNTWYHIAVSNNATSAKLFVNGVQVGSTTTIGDYPSAKTNTVAVGSWGSGWNDSGIPAAAWIGYISNLRVVKGTAVYTSNFTPPTAPLTAISGTVLLTCQNGRFIDNSSVNNTLTPVSTVAVQSFNPFYTSTIASNGGSMYFDGTGDYLTSPTNVNYDFASSNFTIEGWFYFTNGSANQLQCLYSNYTNFSSAGSIYFGKHSSSGSGCVSAWFSNYSTSSPLLTDPTLPPSNAWTHYALVRNSNTFTLYRNGVSVASASFSGAATSGACPAFIGVPGDALVGFNYFFPGYMNGFRITKGTAVYTANFTPPTAPLTPSASTTMLLNGMNAGAYDATAINNMETVGNAQVRFPTPFAPANYWAGVFDGNGDYLTSPSNAAFALGTGDYTVECWIYATSTPSDQGIYEGRSTGTTSDGFTLTAFSGSVIRIFSGGVLVASTGTSYVGQWTHVAVTRASGTTTLWINGVSQGTSATSYNCTNTDAVVGGGRYTGGTTINTSFPGFISNFRIVKGTAVYTSAFTPSTTPLTAISGTSLLTCQNTTFIDNSANAFTITAFGNATAGAIGPFTATGGTSTYFDGSGDNLFMPSSPSMNCGSGNWTVEGWVSTLTRTTNYPLIFGNNRGSFTTDALAITASNADSSPSYLNKFVFAWGSSGFSSPSAGTSALLVSNVTNSNGVWYHLAIVRNGTSIKMYRNGTEVASATVSAGATFNWGFNGSLAGGGNWDGAQGNWNGYLDDLRITNGVARYTANFTPPTTAFPVF